MKRLILPILLSALLFQSCVNYKEIDIKQVKIQKFSLVNTSRANVTFDYLVDNPTNSTLIITSAEGFITKKGVNFAQMELIQPDTIPSKRITSGEISMKIDLLDPISLLSMGLNISSWKVQDFNFDAKITIKTSSGYKKILKFRNVPLEHLTDRL